MPFRQPSRLGSYPHWETTDPDEATLALSQSLRKCRQEIALAPGYLLSTNTAALESLRLTSIFTTNPQQAWTETDGRHYLLMFWNEGWNDYRFSNGRRGRVEPGEGLLSAPYLTSHWKSSPNRDVIVASIPSAALLKEAEDLAGRPIPALQPTGTLQKTGPIWRLLHRFLRRLEDGLYEKPSVLRRERQRRLLTALALGTEHNIRFREERAHNIPPLSALRAKLAKEHMAAHLTQAITLGDLAAAAGTSARGLERAFAYYHQTPLAVFEQMRMEAAHHDLLAPEEHTTVVSVAQKYGFTPSRFAAQYYQFYGEYPSQALQMGRMGRKIF